MDGMMKCVLGLVCAAGAAGAAGAATDGGTGAGTAGKAGAGTSGTAGATGVGGTGGGPATGSDQHDDDGCSVGALGSEKGVATWMLALGLVALGVSRRRR
jgi:MYXO-CTERM domain-containing protein